MCQESQTESEIRYPSGDKEHSLQHEERERERKKRKQAKKLFAHPGQEDHTKATINVT